VVLLHQRKDEMRAIWILVSAFDFFCCFVSNNGLKFLPLKQINLELKIGYKVWFAMAAFLNSHISFFFESKPYK